MIAPPYFASLPEHVSRLGDVDLWRPYLFEALSRHDLTTGGGEPVLLAQHEGRVNRLELTGDGQEGLATKKVLAEVDAAVLEAWQVGQVQARFHRFGC